MINLTVKGSKKKIKKSLKISSLTIRPRDSRKKKAIS